MIRAPQTEDRRAEDGATNPGFGHLGCRLGACRERKTTRRAKRPTPWVLRGYRRPGCGHPCTRGQGWSPRTSSIPRTFPEVRAQRALGASPRSRGSSKPPSGVEISARGGVVTLTGGPEGTQRASHLLLQFPAHHRGDLPKCCYRRSAIRIVKEDPTASLVELFENRLGGRRAPERSVSPPTCSPAGVPAGDRRARRCCRAPPAGTGQRLTSRRWPPAALLESRSAGSSSAAPRWRRAKNSLLPGDLAEQKVIS